MKLWDYRTGKLMKILQPDALSSQVLINMIKKRFLAVYMYFLLALQLYCVKYLNDKTLVVGGSDSNLLRIINLKNYTVSISYVINVLIT